MLHLLTLLACGEKEPPAPAVTATPGPPVAQGLILEGVPVPTGADRERVVATPGGTLDGEPFSVSYLSIIETGQTIGDATFGVLHDRNGRPIVGPDGQVAMCDGGKGSMGAGPDHTTLLEVSGALFMVSQFECQIGSFYIARLDQDDAGGLTPTELRPIDFSGVDGGYVHCAGMRTPWGTHLGSEEYEPDARALKADGTVDRYYDFMAYYWGDPGAPSLDGASPYFYGWIPEVAVTDDTGATSVVKHYAMGRFSHELAYVLPDQKTVYLSDDGTNVGFYLFIADTAADLSAGTLYAAQFTQTSSSGSGTFELSWHNLGHATNDEIDAIVHDDAVFSDLFEVGQVGSCDTAGGFKEIHTGAGPECVKLKEGQALAASRLETRRYAAWVGATTEARKEEGLTWDPDRNQLYMAWSRIEYGLEDNAKRRVPTSDYDGSGPNHIRLGWNACGTVYALPVGEAVDTDGTPIASEHVVRTMAPQVIGVPQLTGGCSPDGIASPDNITYLPGHNLLVMGEDGPDHANAMLWAYDVERDTLTRIMTAPQGGEFTGTYWYPNVGGHGYLMAVVQHPATGPSVVGALGPFPAL
jgi:secreted PhoX family phosphatase